MVGMEDQQRPEQASKANTGAGIEEQSIAEAPRERSSLVEALSQYVVQETSRKENEGDMHHGDIGRSNTKRKGEMDSQSLQTPSSESDDVSQPKKKKAKNEEPPPPFEKDKQSKLVNDDERDAGVESSNTGASAAALEASIEGVARTTPLPQQIDPAALSGDPAQLAFSSLRSSGHLKNPSARNQQYPNNATTSLLRLSSTAAPQPLPASLGLTAATPTAALLEQHSQLAALHASAAAEEAEVTRRLLAPYLLAKKDEQMAAALLLREHLGPPSSQSLQQQLLASMHSISNPMLYAPPLDHSLSNSLLGSAAVGQPQQQTLLDQARLSALIGNPTTSSSSVVGFDRTNSPYSEQEDAILQNILLRNRQIANAELASSLLLHTRSAAANELSSSATGFTPALPENASSTVSTNSSGGLSTSNPIQPIQETSTNRSAGSSKSDTGGGPPPIVNAGEEGATRKFSPTESKAWSAVLYTPKDEITLSTYQCLVRQQIELFEASDDDVQFTISKMSKPVKVRQVGIRCRHCAILPQYARPKAAIYFPRTLVSRALLFSNADQLIKKKLKKKSHHHTTAVLGFHVSIWSEYGQESFDEDMPNDPRGNKEETHEITGGAETGKGRSRSLGGWRPGTWGH